MLPNEISNLSLQTSPEMADRYAALSYDYNPLHLDKEFAAKTAFGAPIAHGTMALNLLLQAIENTFGSELRGENIEIRFSAPVKVGETITAGGTRADDGYAVWVKTEAGATVISGVLRLDRQQ
jgi:acyl dehydratase